MDRLEDPHDRARLTGIFRRWKSVVAAPRRDPALLSADQFRRLPAMGLLMFGLLLLLLDGRLPLNPKIAIAPSALQSIPGSALALGLLVLFLLNAVLIGRFLSLEAGEQRTFPWWLLTLRFLAAGLPLVGIWVIPGWRSRPIIRLSLEGDRGPERCELSADGRLQIRFWLLRLRIRDFIDRLARRLCTPAGLGIWLLSNYFFAFTLVDRFAAGASRLSIGIMSAALHLTLWLWASHFAWTKSGTRPTGDEAALALALPALTLLPVPLFPVFAVCAMLFLLQDLSAETMARRAWESRVFVRSLSPWLRMEEFLRSSWWTESWRKRFRQRPASLDKTREHSPAQWEILKLYAWKTSALMFDATALSWILNRWTAQYFADAVLGVLAVLSLALAAVGLILMLIRFVQKIVRVEGRLSVLDRHPYAVYLAGSQLAFFSGLILGDALERDDGRQIAGLLIAGGFFGAVIRFAPMLLVIFLPVPSSSDRESNAEILWTGLFVLTGLVGISMTQGEPFRLLYLSWIGVFTGLALLTMPVIASRQLGWLLRPFTIGDVLSKIHPVRVRCILAFLAATAALPLGGLAVPAWIFARHRLWPDFMRDQLEPPERTPLRAVARLPGTAGEAPETLPIPKGSSRL